MRMNQSSPPLSMLLQHQVLKWSLLISAIVTFLIVIYVSISSPPERKFYDLVLTSWLTFHYAGLYFFLFQRVTTTRSMDLLSATFLIIPMAAFVVWAAYAQPNEELSGVFIGLLVCASMSFFSHLFYFIVAVSGVCLLVAATVVAGTPLTQIFWMNILFIAPGVAFLTRVAIQKNYELVLERLNYEHQLTSDLATTSDALEISQKDKEQSLTDLRQRDEQLSTVLGNAPLILCVLDKDGVYAQSRGRGLKKIGLEENEIVGTHYSELYDDPAHLEALRKAQQGESLTVRTSLAPGSTHEIRCCPVFGENHEVSGVVGVGIDISKSVIAENEKLELESRLLQAQKMESLGLLASGVVHDFNNYLGAIIGFCEALEHSERTGDSQPNDGPNIPLEIKNIAMNAAGVCEQMLIFAGKSTQTKAEVDLSSLVSDMDQFFRAIVSREIGLTFDLAQQPAFISANRLLIQQAIVNLLKNASEAIRAQSNSKGRILVSTRIVNKLPPKSPQGIRIGEVEQLADEQSFAMITIQDNGGGIAEEDLQRVFEPYFSKKSHGHGFGLAITAGVVKNHNGVIYCESDTSGTRTDLVFPISNIEHTSVVPTIPGPNFKTNDCKRILLVDDEKMITDAIGLALQRNGHQVTTANSGSLGLDSIDAGKEFDCIIIDFSMPEMNGLEFLRKLRDRGVTTPTLMCSGYFDPPKDEDALPHATLVKPYTVKKLTETIAQLCESHSREIAN
jgi:signal transduction histidine kinase/CheY-like chemotaxis protein